MPGVDVGLVIVVKRGVFLYETNGQSEIHTIVYDKKKGSDYIFKLWNRKITVE